MTVHIHDLPRLSTVLAFSYANHVTWLEIFRDVCNVDLKQVELGQVNGFEGDHSVLNLYNCAAHARALTLIHADLVSFHVDSLTALHQCLLNDLLDLGIVTVVVFLVVNNSIAQTRLEVLELFVGWLDVGTSVNLLESEGFEDKATIEKLVANAPHILIHYLVLVPCLHETILYRGS